MGHFFTPNWNLNYGSKEGLIGVSRFNIETVSVMESEPIKPNSLYPNPTDDLITIRINAVVDGPIQYEITSTIGQSVQVGSTNVVGGRCTLIPEQHISSGTYFVRLLRSGKHVFSSPIIVK